MEGILRKILGREHEKPPMLKAPRAEYVNRLFFP